MVTVLTTVEVYRSRFAEFINFGSFSQRTKRVLAANKMDWHSYNAYFVNLLRQLNEALKKCNFVRSIREIWGTPPHEELNAREVPTSTSNGARETTQISKKMIWRRKIKKPQQH